ncbi:unnamed protein product [Closterium sp. Naga37s-1]|nr:unnamed protein product [Closterium sp. Naga37s-1]
MSKRQQKRQRHEQKSQLRRKQLAAALHAKRIASSGGGGGAGKPQRKSAKGAAQTRGGGGSRRGAVEKAKKGLVEARGEARHAGAWRDRRNDAVVGAEDRDGGEERRESAGGSPETGEEQAGRAEGGESSEVGGEGAGGMGSKGGVERGAVEVRLQGDEGGGGGDGRGSVRVVGGRMGGADDAGTEGKDGGRPFGVRSSEKRGMEEEAEGEDEEDEEGGGSGKDEGEEEEEGDEEEDVARRGKAQHGHLPLRFSLPPIFLFSPPHSSQPRLYIPPSLRILCSSLAAPHPHSLLFHCRPPPPLSALPVPCATPNNYAMAQRILLVGEGDFSFTRALLRLMAPARPLALFATALDSRHTIVQKYGEEAGAVLQEVEAGGAHVLFNVDATRLAHTLHLGKRRRKGKANPLEKPFDRIVFNFPHVGLGIKDERINVQRNRQLLFDFFVSAAPLVAPQGEVRVSLRTGHPYSLWNAPALAEESRALRLKFTHRFHADHFPGYGHRRTIGGKTGVMVENTEEGSKSVGAKTFVFCHRNAHPPRSPNAGVVARKKMR